MKQVYLDEDLTTGANDGTSWTDAYWTFTGMDSVESSILFDDITINIRSNGAVPIIPRRLRNWINPQYSITLQGDISNPPIMHDDNTSHGLSVTTDHSVNFHNLIIDGGVNSIAWECGGGTMTNCIAMNASSVSIDIDTGLILGPYFIYNSVIANSTSYGIRVQNGDCECYNCYVGGNATGDYYAKSGTISPINSASSDDTGSIGLQYIPYSTATFVNVTLGSEDLHLVSGSPLIDVGDNFSGLFSIDLEGTPRTDPWDIGAYNYSSSSGSDATVDVPLLSLIESIQTSTVEIDVETTVPLSFLSGTILTSNVTAGTDIEVNVALLALSWDSLPTNLVIDTEIPAGLVGMGSVVLLSSVDTGSTGADAWSYLPGTIGDAYSRMCGTSGDTWSRLAGTVGDAWNRLIQSCGGGLSRFVFLMDSLSITDNITKTVAYFRRIIDAIGLTDTITRMGDYFIAFRDSITIIGILKDTGVYKRFVSSLVDMGDSINTRISFIRKLTTVASISDSLTKIMAFYRKLSTEMSFTDALGQVGAYFRALVDTEHIKEQFKLTGAFFRSLRDIHTVTDGVSRAKKVFRMVLDSVGISDVISRIIHKVSVIFNQLHIQDGLSLTGVFVRKLVDRHTYRDSLIVMGTFIRKVLDAIGISDAVARGMSAIRSIYGILSIGDVLSGISKPVERIKSWFGGPRGNSKVISEPLGDAEIMSAPESTTITRDDAKASAQTISMPEQSVIQIADASPTVMDESKPSQSTEELGNPEQTAMEEGTPAGIAEETGVPDQSVEEDALNPDIPETQTPDVKPPQGPGE